MPTRTLDLILASLALLGPFAIHLFFPVIPVVKLDFELSDALAQLTFSIGVFGMAFSTLVYGTYADRYGRRPVLLIGLLFFLLGSIISALAGSFTSHERGAALVMGLTRSNASSAPRANPRHVR